MLESLRRLTGSPVAEIERYFKTDGQFDFRLEGYRLKATAEQMADARQLIELSLVPASRPEIAPTLNAMALAMPSQGGDMAAEAWMELVWMSVDDFPLDVIHESCRRLVRREKWRPTPAEIRDECQFVGRRRLALRNLETTPGA